MGTGQITKLEAMRTPAGEQSLSVEHRASDPRYVVTYRTYSSHHDADGNYHVILMWRIVYIFSEREAYITETTTYDNEIPVGPGPLLLWRMKVASQVGNLSLPRDTHRASVEELLGVWRDIKTRKRIP